MARTVCLHASALAIPSEPLRFAAKVMIIKNLA